MFVCRQNSIVLLRTSVYFCYHNSLTDTSILFNLEFEFVIRLRDSSQ